MFFYSRDHEAGQSDFERLCALATETLPPVRAKVHRASDAAGAFVTALIYPAESDDEVSRWLLDIAYRTDGAVEAGISAVQRYYDAAWTIHDRRQLWGRKGVASLQGQALRDAAGKALVR